jgi:hypothetical protein
MLTREKKKLTIRVDAGLIEQAKTYAQTHNTSISRLIEDYFQELDRQEHIKSSTPILDELTGILPEPANVDDYYDYLTEKYSGDQ